MLNQNLVANLICSSNGPCALQTWLGHTSYNNKIYGDTLCNSPGHLLEEPTFLSGMTAGRPTYVYGNL